MVNEEDLLELNSNFDTRGNCTSKLFSLLFIPAFIYILVVLSFFKIIPLKVEIHSVILIGFIFIIYLFFIKHNAYRASCQFRKQFASMKEQLKLYITKHKVTINQTTKANASVEDFLSEFTRDLRNTNFSSVAASIFPTLGILGTFISIAISMPDFSSKSSAMLEQEISLLLGGVGTAFYVSIYGIFLSIWWIFFEKIGISRFEHDIDIIKENSKDLFWNKIEIDKIHFQKSIENYEKLNAVFTKVSSNDIIKSLDESLETKLVMFDKLINSEEKIINTTKEFYDINFEKQKKIVNSYDTIIKQLEIMTPILNKSLKNINEIVKNYDIQEKDISNATQDLNANIHILNNALSNLSSKNIEKIYENIIKNIEIMKVDSDRIGWKFNQHLTNFDENLNVKLKNSLELIDEHTSSIVKQLASIKD
jgi:hypothetical protein